LYFYFRSKEEVLYQIATSALDFTIEVAATEAKALDRLPSASRPVEPFPS
jgi:AcrR family transcriptional regulator